MDVIGTVLSVAQTLFSALQSVELREFFSVHGYESQLDELQNTVDTIKAVFKDADRMQALSAVQKKLIQDLKDVVYEADDLLDEFVTIAQQKQLLNADGGISNKMQRFLHRTNPFGVAKRMSKGVNKIKKKLDAIAYNKQFSFDHDPEPIRLISRDTSCHLDVGGIIGREQDLEKIVGVLLDPNVQRDVSFLGIVGIGGLGKTALAQLVYNDPRITSAFHVRKWACVSDEGKNQFDIRQVLGKILGHECSTLDQAQSQLRQHLAGNRYLLVLDDVWTEKREIWRSLVQYFVGGQRGSWIMVTMRSRNTAEILEDGQVYELEGLSKENSWRLFERTAFGSDNTNCAQDLVEIGQGIVKKCARIPLAIRVVGSLLYGQHKRKWQFVHENGLAGMRDNENDIMPLLKLSYYHLESSLKICFSYCAMFPKDFEIKKEMLISLWIAQGYIIPFDESQSVEDAGEEHFFILLKRCFFQDIKKDVVGDVYSVKLHDLIHDMAQLVSVKEIYATSTIIGNLDKRVRHFSIGSRWEYVNYSFKQSHIRSLICTGMEWLKVDDVFLKKLVASSTCLRALDLAKLTFRRVPDSIGTLLHIRYLDLSYNVDLEVLPKTVSKLCNLQTLKLNRCTNLKELPRDFNKLVKLSALEISDCSRLSYMPKGMTKLTCLSRLSDYIVGGQMSCSSRKQWFEGLEDIKNMKNLKGRLFIHIKWPKNVEDVGKKDFKEKQLYLRNKEHLNNILIGFGDEEGKGRMDDAEKIGLMEDLHPHPNLKVLCVWQYSGTRIPEWVSRLPKLVMLTLSRCKELEYLASFGSVGEMELFPLLEKLRLAYLPTLKVFMRGIARVGYVSNSGKAHMQLLPFLSHLKRLEIYGCPELIQFPRCPNLEFLELINVSKRMIFKEAGPVSTSAPCNEVANLFPKLREMETNMLDVMPVEAIQGIVKLSIVYNGEVKNLGIYKDAFCSCSSSLKILEFKDCKNLKSVVGGLKHLTALEELHFIYCENLKFTEEEIEGEFPSLLPSLQTLKFFYLPKLENLPSWMQFLTTLQTLDISGCKSFIAIPIWMPKLTSLKDLCIVQCSKRLEKRCQKHPPGEDWHLLQHIPSIRFLPDGL